MAEYSCVPFCPEWAKQKDEQPDARAIYRRPRLDKWGRRMGGWDQVTLPIRRHADWVAKGFEYVTLADNESLQMLAKDIRAMGYQLEQFLNGPGRRVWEPDLYLAAALETEAKDLAELTALVAEFGLEAVTKIKRQIEPGWNPPPELLPPLDPLPEPPSTPEHTARMDIEEKTRNRLEKAATQILGITKRHKGGWPKGRPRKVRSAAPMTEESA